ncbi:MAPEG family protein [Microvirga pudoricolor]|uniref:MAPEG family protein n=1 Tax=Microvirga pudoricolor TaxID=2778729 RepID=UPI0019520494|nr:MAPEG family protein [Microvirga pudoricolor]MBM6594160.1 MAPEG family protein [Microvirga pudoricolor]
MSVSAILLPVFVQVGLIFALLLWMGRSRMGALRSGEVKVKDIALGERNWPNRATQAANAFSNQFEIPLLFFVLVAFAMITRKADMLFVVLSWMFVASRLVHALVHTTSNQVPLRFMAYLAGVIILMIMWVVFALRIFAAQAGVG